MSQFLLYGHGSCLNHGCEAIIRTTASMVKNVCQDSYMILSTLDYHSDCNSFPFINEFIKNNKVPDNLLFNGVSYINSKIFPQFKISDLYRYTTFNKWVRTIQPGIICLSVGGDNYCTANPTWLYSQNSKLDKYGAKRILWGASIEPETISLKMMEDLNGYQAIFARESITYDALIKKGYSGDLYLCPDPAFTLNTDLSKVPTQMNEGQWVGLNLSPVILRSETVEGVTYNNYCNLIRHIIDNTDYNIALIPHVVIDGNSDYDAMETLYNEFGNTGRILQISRQYNACQYKGIISKCVMFIGARTHATIAAYSNCVPTLVVGYSVKAKGIAKDLFGTYDGYVIAVQDIKDENEIINLFTAFDKQKDDIRAHLEEVMPKYIEDSRNATDLLKKETML